MGFFLLHVGGLTLSNLSFGSSRADLSPAGKRERESAGWWKRGTSIFIYSLHHPQALSVCVWLWKYLPSIPIKPFFPFFSSPTPGVGSRLCAHAKLTQFNYWNGNCLIWMERLEPRTVSNQISGCQHSCCHGRQIECLCDDVRLLKTDKGNWWMFE